MPLNAEVLVKEAICLPYADRAKLIDTLLTTLDPIVEDDCDTAWFAEIARREQSLVDGTAQLHSWEAIKGKARESVRG